MSSKEKSKSTKKIEKKKLSLEQKQEVKLKI